MTAGYGIALLAALLQMQDAPDMAGMVGMLAPYKPDAAYVGVTVIEDELVYAGGIDWLVGSRWGVAAEYRHWPGHVRFAGTDYRTVTHAAGGYLYRELPAWGRVTLRTEAGGGAVWANSELQMSSTWAAGLRASGRVALTDRLALVAWVGTLRVGSGSASDGRARVSRGRETLAETGVALRVNL